MREVTIRDEVWPIRGVFAISRGSRTETKVIVVEIREGDCVGRGEGQPYSRYKETVDGVVAEIEGLRDRLQKGMERDELQEALSPGAARNAIDCALWDLEAKKSGRRMWQVAGLSEPSSCLTAFTLSVDTPEKMGESAKANAGRPLLKLKLTGDGDMERVKAVRANAPRSRLIVDANEAWTPDMFRAFVPEMAHIGVELIEQPFPAGDDEILRELYRPTPVCADESCHTRADIPRLTGLYDYLNIKLDKTGGMTEALKLAHEGREAGFRLMVGCMLGTSLAMAPGVIIGQSAEFVDLDGPLLLEQDREGGLEYRDGQVLPPVAALWG